MAAPVVHFWKKSLFIRLLPAFITGIIIQWYLPIPFYYLLVTTLACLVFLVAYGLISIASRYKLSFLNGIVIFLLLACLGSLLTYTRDVRHSCNWYGNYYSDSSTMMVTVIEPPVIKERSIKLIAGVLAVINDNHYKPASGRIILYLPRTIPISSLQYGTCFLFKKKLQEIRNSGNPGAFDYRQYCLFQGIIHQLYLNSNDFVRLPTIAKKEFSSIIFTLKQQVLSILKRYIPGEKEKGLAEALLVGYRDDLDKSLVQSYSNTGVVHIIAISGLHLGLIYWLLVQLCKPLCRRKKINWFSPLIIISGLWLFSFLAGAQPSVLRSALMFSCIAMGESMNRKTNTYNSLALSAFLLLCYNPFWLWDTGFQLSYAAVLSLVVFMRSINNLVCFSNKLLMLAWKLNAVTISAQVLTTPLCIYYFHQLPLCFLLTNFIAVPLSSIILMGEIALVVFSFIPFVATVTGQAISWMIHCMNGFIESVDWLPFSTWSHLQISLPQTILVFLLIIAFSYWLMEKVMAGLKLGLGCLFVFFMLRSLSLIAASRQRIFIVYNIPQKQAVDLVAGRVCQFIGDSSLDTGKNVHLNPARTAFRCVRESIFVSVDNLISWQGKSFLFLDTTLAFKPALQRPVIDFLILSGNPRTTLKNLVQALNIKQIIGDGSVPRWKALLWKKDCEQYHISWHDVGEKGAFAMNLR